MKLQGDFVSLCFFALGLGAWGNSQPLVRQTLAGKVWTVGVAGHGGGLLWARTCM